MGTRTTESQLDWQSAHGYSTATKVRIKEAKKYSKRLKKAFEPAFILDSFAEEREQEMTYDTTRAEIKYKDIALD